MKTVNCIVKNGKFGPIYSYGPGVKIRYNDKGVILVELEKGPKRKNISFGTGEDALKKAKVFAEQKAKEREKPVPQTTHNRTKLLPTLIAMCVLFVKTYRAKWPAKTYERYHQIVRDYISEAEEFNQPVDQVTRLHVKTALLRWLEHLSPSSIETTKRVISGGFDLAKDAGYIGNNPTERILADILPSKKNRRKKQIYPLSYSEREKFFEVAKNRYASDIVMILKIMFYMGLRVGEALAFRKENLNRGRANTYCVREQYLGHGEYGPPKNQLVRDVDVPLFLMDELNDYIENLEAKMTAAGQPGEADLLFINPNSKQSLPLPRERKIIYDIVQRICKRAGLKPRRTHDLRHSYASVLLLKMSAKYVQRQLGHQSIQVTFDLYGHLFLDSGRKGLDNCLLGHDRAA